MLGGVGIVLNDTPGVPEGAQGPHNTASNDAIAQRVARLTAGQLDCLRLVDQHLSSKEIAAELGISPHTKASPGCSRARSFQSQPARLQIRPTALRRPETPGKEQSCANKKSGMPSMRLESIPVRSKS